MEYNEVIDSIRRADIADAKKQLAREKDADKREILEKRIQRIESIIARKRTPLDSEDEQE